jgi:hypothetical protein
MSFLRGFWLFFVATGLVCALMIPPPEVARWFAIGLLVLVALTPAIGKRNQPSNPRRTSRVRGAGS